MSDPTITTAPATATRSAPVRRIECGHFSSGRHRVALHWVVCGEDDPYLTISHSQVLPTGQSLRDPEVKIFLRHLSAFTEAVDRALDLADQHIAAKNRPSKECE